MKVCSLLVAVHDFEFSRAVSERMNSLEERRKSVKMKVKFRWVRCMILSFTRRVRERVNSLAD
jgi:hypothetical protein